MEEKKSHIVFKRILYISIVSLMFLPLVQQKFNFVEVEPLSGDYKIIEKPNFIKEEWWNGEFQDEYQEYVNQNMGFRPLFVRIYNQMYYSLHNQARANGVIVGKKNYLYEYQYVDSYLGKDYIGEEKIKEKINKLIKIRDTLASNNISLMIIIAPGKGFFYPEFIPEKYNTKERATTNYDVYSKEFLKTDLHLLDFNKWFMDTKDTSLYPLMPKTGIHWSKYGEAIVADSIINYINLFLNEKKVPKLLIGEIDFTDEIRDSDHDIEKGMNLMFSINNIKMAYPQLQLQENFEKESPRVLTIADSFYWGMFNFGLSRDYFNNGQFWFYNQQIYPDSYYTPLSVGDINIVEEVEKNDVVMILATERNLSKLGFGFIDQLYDAYFSK